MYHSARHKQRVHAMERKAWLQSNKFLLLALALTLAAYMIAGINDTHTIKLEKAQLQRAQQHFTPNMLYTAPSGYLGQPEGI